MYLHVTWSALEKCPFPNKEVATKTFNHNGGNIIIKEHDVLIHIPQNAISNNDLVEVKTCGSLVGPFKMPPGYERVSAYVWVGSTYKFQKCVQMYLQHFEAADNEEDIKDLCLMTASECDKTTESGEDVYLMHEDETEHYFEAGCDECYILTKSWCTKCVAKKRKPNAGRCLAFGYLSRPMYHERSVQISFEICICYSLAECSQNIKDQHKECVLLKSAPMPFILQKNRCLYLEYSKQCAGWEISHTGKPKITKQDIDFQHYKFEDLEELEKINAYPPRFFLTFRSGGSIQHLSTNIVVQIGKPKQKLRSKHDETEVLDFPINTLDYIDFMKILSVPSSSKPGDAWQAVSSDFLGSPVCKTMSSTKCKEYCLFLEYFVTMTCTLTDIDTLLPHFIPKGIIKIEDLDEIKAKPKLSDHVHQLLKCIEGPLRIRNAESFYALLDVMSTHGNLCTKKLAAIMKGKLQDNQIQGMQHVQTSKVRLPAEEHLHTNSVSSSDVITTSVEASHVITAGLSPPSVGFNYDITDGGKVEMAGEYKVTSV